MKRIKKQQQGFTLVELSIVLVIIGLIVGGVLVGQDLIAAAQIRSQVTQLNQYDAAVNTFRSQYNGLPGDGAQNVALGLQTNPGNGNGVIEGNAAAAYGAGTNEPDSGEFFEALSTAELIPGTFQTRVLPQVRLEKGLLAATSIGSINYYVLGAAGTPGIAAASNLTVADGLAISGFQSWSIDTKIDDGIPDSGIMQAKQSATAIWGNADIATMRGTYDNTNCTTLAAGAAVAPATNAYIIQKKGAAAGAIGDCPVFVRIQG